MIARRTIAVAVVLSTALLAGCASGSKDPFAGTKSLEATVVERQYDPPGSGGASYAGTGNYYLVFEGKEGDATAHYRFRVTHQQYLRFPEGSRVQIVVVDNNLRDIRPLQ
ncbi:MAG TPA: hypothetical protein VGS98_13345 [Thermoanaerobaculia bacterium]|nr:hypothetical protein [Thermoanaerobaculia bacterium]